MSKLLVHCIIPYHTPPTGIHFQAFTYQTITQSLPLTSKQIIPDHTTALIAYFQMHLGTLEKKNLQERSHKHKKCRGTAPERKCLKANP